MAFPVFESYTGSQDTSPTTSFTLTMPGTVDAGDLLLAYVATNGAVNAISQASWTELDQGDTTSFIESAIYYKEASAGEPASYTVSLSSAPNAVAGCVVRLSNWDSGTPPNNSAITDFAASVNPDPASHTGFGGPDDFMFVNFIGLADDAETVSSYSSGWTGRGNTTANGGANLSVGVACQTLNDNTATTVDPGTLTLSGSDLGNSTIAACLGVAGGGVAPKAHYYRNIL